LNILFNLKLADPSLPFCCYTTCLCHWCCRDHSVLPPRNTR